MSQMSVKATDTIHNIILENKEKLSISGVDDVKSFDEMQIIAQTKMGYLVIKGTMLHVHKFNQGELNITGNINELKYAKKRINHSNFFEKIFK